MKTQRSKPEISVVIPLYNEQENVPPLYEELSSAMNSLGRSYEVIVVDDGSTDNSFQKLKAIQEKDPNWRIIRFRRNFGQTAGMTAGFDAVRGDIIITSDADLQNDPQDIGKLLDKMEEGYDIVSGWRVDRKEPFFTRRLPSMTANKLISNVTGVHLHDYGCTLKAYRREVIDNVDLYGELHRFIPALASSIGVKVAEVPVNDRARRFGKSKYGISRTFRVILDLITVFFLLKYATKPMHFFGTIGFTLAGIGTVLGLWLSYERLFLNVSLSERPLLMLAVLLVMIGVNILTVGVVAEMVMRNYYKPQGKATYIIREIAEEHPKEAPTPIGEKQSIA